MDLRPSPEQASLWRRAAAFAREELRGGGSSFQIAPQSIDSLVAKAHAIGLLDYWLPGRGNEAKLDFGAVALVAEELAWAEGAFGLLLADRFLCYRAARLLPEGRVKGDLIARLRASTSPFEVVWLWPESRTPVFREDDGRLCAASSMSLFGADTRMVIAPVAVEANDSEDRWFFVIDASKQVDARPARTLGLQALPFAAITCAKKIDDGDLAYKFKSVAESQNFRNNLLAERALVYSAVVLGGARAAFEYALDYASRRKAFGRPIIQHQAVALKLADMATGIEASRLALWQASSSSTGSTVNDRLAWQSWRTCRKVALEAAIDAVQILGGHGYLKCHPVEKWMRDIEFLRLIGGQDIRPEELKHD